MVITNPTSVATKAINVAFLIILNIALMSVIGHMTLDSEANLNSRLGGLLLSITMPLCIVFMTKHMSGLERLIKFGSGFAVYIVLAAFTIGIPESFVTWLIPCLVIGMAVLFYGKFKV
jgi:hypothetical protein